MASKIPQPQQAPQAQQLPARLSHKAAAVAQQMENLEDELSAAIERAQAMENRAKVAEARLGDLIAELKEVKADRDLNHQLWTEVRAKLEASASIILDAMDHKSAVAHRSRQEALDAVERSLAETPLQPAPAFLSATRETNGAGG